MKDPLWQASNADEEIGRLAKGHGAMIKGTNIISSIPISAIPNDRKAPTYRRVVSVQCPEKDNPRRVRWAVGGDKFDYPFDVSTKTADLTTANKLLFNSALRTLNAKFLATNLKDLIGHVHDLVRRIRIPLLFMLPDANIEQ